MRGKMIQPHGNELIDRQVGSERSAELKDGFDDLTTITLDQNLLFDFTNLAVVFIAHFGGSCHEMIF